MESIFAFLNTPAGQAVGLAAAGLLAMGVTALGKRLGVTPGQVEETVEALKKAGHILRTSVMQAKDFKKLAKEVNVSIKHTLKGKVLGK